MVRVQTGRISTKPEFDYHNLPFHTEEGGRLRALIQAARQDRAPRLQVGATDYAVLEVRISAQAE